MIRFRGSLAMIAVSAGSTLAGCAHEPAGFQRVALKGFSPGNYRALDEALGRRVCVTGRLSIDSFGVYYPLGKLEEDDGVINLGFSRVKADMSRSAALARGLVDNGVQTMCGVLREATPFEGCDANDCKWYALSDDRASTRRADSQQERH